MDLNTGIEFYNTTLHYRANEINLNNDTTVKSTAANVNLSLGVEVGIGKRVGIGLRGKANKFFEDVDDVADKNTNIASTDLLVMINFHPLVRKKLDVVIGADLGLSGLNFKLDDLDNTTINGNGSYFSLYLNPRLYFRRFGFNLKTYLPFVTYNDLESNGKNFDRFVVEKWKGSGFGVTIGVQVRLF